MKISIIAVLALFAVQGCGGIDAGGDGSGATGAVSQATLDAVGRKQYLLTRKSDIEFAIARLNQERTTLAALASQLSVRYAQPAFDDPAALGMVNQLPTITLQNLPTGLPDGFASTLDGMTYEQATSLIASYSRQVERRLADLQVQQKEIETEIESVQKILERDIEKTFKYGG